MTWSATAESRSGRCARQSSPCGYSSLTSCKRTDWHRRPTGAVVGEQGRTNPLAALEELRRRIRTRHYSYRTERTYADWVRRFFTYLAGRQGAPHPRLDSDAVRDYLTHLAVRQRVSASSQNQALSAILFLCREVLGVEVEDVSATVRAKRGTRLPAVLSMPETARLLGGLRGKTWLMAALIYGGELRVSECCQLRVKDIDFDQGRVFVRSGKGNKDRSTLLAEVGREELLDLTVRAGAPTLPTRYTRSSWTFLPMWGRSTATLLGRVGGQDVQTGTGRFVRVHDCRGCGVLPARGPAPRRALRHLARRPRAFRRPPPPSQRPRRIPAPSSTSTALPATTKDSRRPGSCLTRATSGMSVPARTRGKRWCASFGAARCRRPAAVAPTNRPSTRS